MSDRVLVSRAEYGRMRGVSHTAVNKAVAAGRITLVDGKIDPAAADLEWTREKAERPVQLSLRGEEESRIRRAKAVVIEAAAARVTGEVVSVSEVREALGEMVSRVKSRLLLVPSKVGMKFGVPVQREVEAQIVSALQELSDEAA